MEQKKKSYKHETHEGLQTVLVKGSSVMKKKIRDIERTLKKDNLPSDVRLDNERSLQALKIELQNKLLNNKAKVLSKKYHMVRFFEKKKVIRRWRQAVNNLEDAIKQNDTFKIEEKKKELRQREIDVGYVILFPKHEKYVSLFTKDDSPTLIVNNGNKSSNSKSNEIKDKIRKQISDMIIKNGLPFSFDSLKKSIFVDFKKTKYLHSFEKEVDAPKLPKNNNSNDNDFFDC